MERENFKSRLGFILVSAGCAIGKSEQKKCCSRLQKT